MTRRQFGAALTAGVLAGAVPPGVAAAPEYYLEAIPCEKFRDPVVPPQLVIDSMLDRMVKKCTVLGWPGIEQVKTGWRLPDAAFVIELQRAPEPAKRTMPLGMKIAIRRIKEFRRLAAIDIYRCREPYRGLRGIQPGWGG